MRPDCSKVKNLRKKSDNRCVITADLDQIKSLAMNPYKKDEGIAELRTLNSDYQSLIEEYRQTNRDTRSTPEPTYFRDIPKLDEAPIDGIDIPALDGIDQQKLIDTMETFSQRLQEEFDRLVKEVRTSAEVIDGRDPLAIAGGS